MTGEAPRYQKWPQALQAVLDETLRLYLEVLNVPEESIVNIVTGAASRLAGFHGVLLAEDLIAEIGSMMSVSSWSKVETEARRSAYNDVLAVISDRLAAATATAAQSAKPTDK